MLHVFRTIANVTQSAVGKEKYSIGFKGGWPTCANSTKPETCVFDDEAKHTLRYIKNTLGVMHAAFWVDEARSQGQWDAQGFFLHGE